MQPLVAKPIRRETSAEDLLSGVYSTYLQTFLLQGILEMEEASLLDVSPSPSLRLRILHICLHTLILFTFGL
jgi:hypothetical protein